MHHSEKGATIWQFAIVLPLLMLLVVAIIDFGRFSALRAVIQAAVNHSAEVAVTVPNLDVDPRGRLETDVEFQRLQLARSKAGEAGHRFIDSFGLVLTQSDTSQAAKRGTKLFDIVFTERRIAGSPYRTRNKFAVILPGECVQVPLLALTECNRETLGTTPSHPAPVEPPTRLMQRHPVKVVAWAIFDGYLPFLANRTFKVYEYKYRQPIPQGPFPAFEDPGLAGGIGKPTTPKDNEPIGAPNLPPEPPTSCHPDWFWCIRDSIVKTQPAWQRQAPAYWLPGLPDGRCVCRPISTAR